MQHYTLLVPKPRQTSYSEYIPKFLKEFQSLYKSPIVKSGYKSGVEGISTHSGMLSYVSEGGKYWNVLDDATKEEVIFQYCLSLDQVLLDSTIKVVVSNMFGVKKDLQAWTDPIKAYAYEKYDNDSL